MASPLTIGLTVFAMAIAGAWIAIVLLFVKACRQRSLLQPASQSDSDTELPALSVIVAARNESACIETCIRSLFRQDYPHLEVVAVNDRSNDDTGEILDRLAIEFSGRLHVLHVAMLPAGWFGKPHALDMGMQLASGNTICFTDADCEFLNPAALRSAVIDMIRDDVDFISIAAKYTMSSLRECIVVPCCAESLLAWLRPERVSDPDWPDAFANGSFIMVKRTPFESIGGWSSVRMKISEDLEMARLAKSRGLRLKVTQGEGFYQTRSYCSLRESWNGWSRIMKGVLTPAQLTITLVRMFILFVMPLAAMVWGVSNALHTGSLDWLTHGAGLAFLIAFSLRCVLDVIMFRLVGAPVKTFLFAPFGRLFVMLAATRALLSHAGLVTTHWRGANFVGGQMIMPETVKA
ncbi:MAG: glycosyltransferase [Planctomycetaceae bacterium]|nr:glycosyltransferase [Planctomycetaceae bacterium]